LAHYCGDGKLDAVDLENDEECDDGHDTSTEYNGCTTACKRVNFCGDCTVQPDHEQCDDGNEDADERQERVIVHENALFIVYGCKVTTQPKNKPTLSLGITWHLNLGHKKKSLQNFANSC
jgi:hypothetical protein